MCGNGVLLSAQLSDAAVARAASQSLEAAVAATLSPRQLAGQRVIYGYSGLTPPASLLTLIRQGQVGGVIFFGGNYQSRSQFTAAVRQLEAANRAATNPARDYPLLLMTDQEGGYVKRLPGRTGSLAEVDRRRAPPPPPARTRPAEQAPAPLPTC